MRTLLYDIDTQTAGQIREGRYIVDGKTGIYPSNYAELVVYDPPNPSYDVTTQKLDFSSFYADLPSLLWTRNKTIVDKTPEEIAEYEEEQQRLQKELEFETAVNAGYAVPNSSLILGINDSDRILWNQLLTLLNQQLESGQITTSTNITISDINDVQHQVTVAEAKDAIGGLGMYYYGLWTNKNS
jgi:hypothetical protein